MSGYQFYEFLAIDRPLGREEQELLRKFSSEARIDATTFAVLHDTFTDFPGDPRELMERWFDLHLLRSSMGTRRLMMRVPERSLQCPDLEPFFRHVDWVDVETAGGNTIVDAYLGELLGYDGAHEEWDDGGRRLASIAPLRAAVMSGDLRLFYLLWLLAVKAEEVPDDEVEPLPGIGPLTGALEVAAEFFGIDANLLQVAAEHGAERSTSPACGGGRTAIALRTRMRELEKGEAERHKAERRRLARIRLDALNLSGDEIWQKIEEEIQRRTPSGYNIATRLLSDLQILATEEKSRAEYIHRSASIRVRHEKKHQLIARLRKLGPDDN